VPITESARHDMLTALEAAIGKEAAMTMADHLPPVGWADVATKHDLMALEERLTTKVELHLERTLHTFSNEIRREMHDGQRTLFFAILGAFVANAGIVLGVLSTAGT